MKNFSNIKWFLHICIISVVCVFIGACATGRPSESVQRIDPSFDYNPSETTAGKTNITFAVVGSQFEAPFDSPRVPLFERFSSNMADDFAEIITARGYTLRGPFRTFDEMTFIDKDNSNLILTAKVELKPDLSQTEIVFVKNLLTAGGTWRISGQVIVTGRISLIVSESLTNEKMWTKSVNIRPITAELTPMRYALSNITIEDTLKNDDKFYTSLGLKLDRQYHEIMNRTYGYLDPREMSLISKQAAELKKRKIF